MGCARTCLLILLLVALPLPSAWVQHAAQQKSGPQMRAAFFFQQ
jgi:hypothetical protein